MPSWQGAQVEMTNATILCVDDEETPRTLRKLVLQKQGYEVVTASSGKEALAILATRYFDLVLTDQMMPGMMGTDLARQVKLATPSMPVVIISGVNELPGDACYADRFISKIEGPEALFKGHCRSILSGHRRPTSQPTARQSHLWTTITRSSLRRYQLLLVPSEDTLGCVSRHSFGIARAIPLVAELR